MTAAALPPTTLGPHASYGHHGTSWPDGLPAHWSTARIRHAATVNPARSDALRDLSPEDPVVFLPMEAVSASGYVRLDQRRPLHEVRSGFTHFRQGDVLVAKITPCFENGKGAFLKHLPTQIGFGSTEFHVLRPSRTIRGDYLYLVTMIPQFRVAGRDAMVGAAGQQRVPTDFFKNFLAPLPPLDEQAAIARYCAHLDAKVNRLIRNKRRLIALLNEQKRIVIQHAVTRGIEPTGPLKDSGLAWIGEIPAHWEIRRVKDEFANLNRRRVPLSSTQRGEMVTREYDYYGASGVIDKVDDCLFDEDLLLIAEDGANLVLRGKPLAIIARGRYWVNNHAHILKPRSGSLEFFAHALERIDYRPWITGAAQPKLTADRLMAIPVVVPPVYEQHRIVGWIEAETRTLSETAKTAAREIDLIREYRNRLVADVVTGQLDVRAAAASLPDLDPLDAAEPHSADLDMDMDEDGNGLDEHPDEDADAAD